MNKIIKLAVVDDDDLFREILTLYLSGRSDMEVVLTASHGEELIDKLKSADEKPDIILLDLLMPGMDGEQTTDYLKKNYRGIKIIILTFYEEPAISKRLMKKGANGFLLKDTPREKLAEIIQVVQKHKYYFGDSEMQEIFASSETEENKPVTLKNGQVKFSQRELEILKLVCQGLSSKEISEKLFIGKRTVETHKRNMFKRTSTTNVAGLISYAYNHKLIS